MRALRRRFSAARLKGVAWALQATSRETVCSPGKHQWSVPQLVRGSHLCEEVRQRASGEAPVQHAIPIVLVRAIEQQAKPKHARAALRAVGRLRLAVLHTRKRGVTVVASTLARLPSTRGASEERTPILGICLVACSGAVHPTRPPWFQEPLIYQIWKQHIILHPTFAAVRLVSVCASTSPAADSVPDVSAAFNSGFIPPWKVSKCGAWE